MWDGVPALLTATAGSLAQEWSLGSSVAREWSSVSLAREYSSGSLARE